MDYMFHDKEAKLSILVSCKKKGQDSFCTAELQCGPSKMKETYSDPSDIIKFDNDWELNDKLREFIRKHLDEDLNYRELMKQISRTLKDHEPLTVIELLNMIEQSYFYPDTHNIDVSLSGQVFTVREEDYQSARKLKTWIMSQFGRILNISDKDWQHVVKHIRDSALTGKVDPTAPPVLTTLLDLIENNNIYSDFCEDLISNLLSGGSQVSFLLKDDTLYIPSDVYDFLRRKFAMSYGTIRQYMEKYLENKTSSEVETIYVHGKRKSFRFWHFSFEKLWELRSTLSQKEVIEVTTEEKEKLYAIE